MNPTNEKIDRENRFALCYDLDSQKHVVSIPVSNRLVDYEEYYEITEAAFSAYPENKEEIKKFAEECRRRLHDDKLLIKPGRDRGVG